MSLFEALQKKSKPQARIVDYLRWVALVVLIAIALVFAVILAALVIAGDSAADVVENLLHHIYTHYGLIPVLVLLLVVAVAAVAFALQLVMTYVVYWKAYAEDRGGNADGGSTGERPALLEKPAGKTGWSRGYYQGVILLVTNAALALLLVAGVVYALGYVGIDVAEQPEFCTMCHEVMDKPYETYAASSHKGIACGECHNDPGVKGFIKGEVIAPIKEGWLQAAGDYHLEEPMVVPINNESCLRAECHKEKRLREKEFRFGQYRFSHGKHLDLQHGGDILSCAACHTYDWKVHMKVEKAVCGLCHFSSKSPLKEANCEACHAGRRELADEQAELLHREVVDFKKQSCRTCHEAEKSPFHFLPEGCAMLCHHHHGGKKKTLTGHGDRDLHGEHRNARCMDCHWKVEHKIGSAKFRSAPMDAFGKKFTHQTHGGDCSDCHGVEAGHFALELKGRADCNACHHEGVDDPETCADCHKTQDEFFKGLEKFGFEETPSVKSEAEMGCDTCHGEKMDRYEPKMARATCAECHEGDPDYDCDKHVGAGRKTLEDAMSELKKVEALIELSSKKDPNTAKARGAASSARKMLEFLYGDGSFGLHNPGLFEEYATKIRELLKEAGSLLDKARKGGK